MLHHLFPTCFLEKNRSRWICPSRCFVHVFVSQLFQVYFPKHPITPPSHPLPVASPKSRSVEGALSATSDTACHLDVDRLGSEWGEVLCIYWGKTPGRLICRCRFRYVFFFWILMSYVYQHIDDLTDTFWYKTQMGLNQQMRIFIGLFGVVVYLV